jgi:hypothetical protein
MPDTAQPPVYNRDDPGWTIPGFLGAQLARLGIGERRTRVGTTHGRPMYDFSAPPGLGCCRVRTVREALWPAGADLCAVVTWSPDHEIAKQGRKGELEEHRRIRTAAVLEALESLGYRTRIPGPRQDYSTPYVPTQFFIYRLASGAAAVRWPEDGWVHLGRPTDHPSWLPWSPEAEPHRALTRLLQKSDLARSRFVCGAVDEFEWPPYASECLTASWKPGAGAARSDWDAASRTILDFLHSYGYRTKVRERPWNLTTDRHGPYVIAYRTIERGGRTRAPTA